MNWFDLEKLSYTQKGYLWCVYVYEFETHRWFDCIVRICSGFFCSLLGFFGKSVHFLLNVPLSTAKNWLQNDRISPSFHLGILLKSWAAIRCKVSILRRLDRAFSFSSFDRRKNKFFPSFFGVILLIFLTKSNFCHLNVYNPWIICRSFYLINLASFYLLESHKLELLL